LCPWAFMSTERIFFHLLLHLFLSGQCRQPPVQNKTPPQPEVWCHRCRRLTPMEARWGAPLPIPPCRGSPSLPPLRGCPRPLRATTPQGIASQRGTALRGGRSSRRAWSCRSISEPLLSAPCSSSSFLRPDKDLGAPPHTRARAAGASRSFAGDIEHGREQQVAPPFSLSIPGPLSPAVGLFLPTLSVAGGAGRCCGGRRPRSRRRMGRRRGDFFAGECGGEASCGWEEMGSGLFFNAWGPPDCPNAYILRKILNPPKANIRGRGRRE
jgi:hypothetical protein